MADIKFNCPSCSQSLEASKEMVGQIIECPSCNQTITVAESYSRNAVPLPTNQGQTKACSFCGETILSTAQKCKHCGEWLNNCAENNKTAAPKDGESEKYMLPLLLLWLFLGCFGAHSFYAGRNQSGVIYVALTLICVIFIFGVFIGDIIFAPLFLIILWLSLLVDFIQIVTGRYKNGRGDLISQWT